MACSRRRGQKYGRFPAQGQGREGIQEKQKRKSGTEQPGTTHGKSNADRKQGPTRNGQEQTENHASQGSSQSGKPSIPGGGGNTTLNTGRNAKDSSDPEQAAPEVVVGTARRGVGKKSDPLPETKLPPDELPQNTEKDKPYSAEDDNSLHEETSDGKREALLLKEAGIEAVPARKYTPEQKNELERAIRRYDAVRARMSDADRRAADEYYRRLREILKQ